MWNAHFAPLYLLAKVYLTINAHISYNHALRKQFVQLRKTHLIALRKQCILFAVSVWPDADWKNKNVKQCILFDRPLQIKSNFINKYEVHMVFRSRLTCISFIWLLAFHLQSVPHRIHKVEDAKWCSFSGLPAK